MKSSSYSHVPTSGDEESRSLSSSRPSSSSCVEKNARVFLGLFVTLTVLVLVSLALAGAFSKPLNIVFCISDGFGPASETLARDFVMGTYSNASAPILPLDTFLVGASRTYSSNSYVTDSAAGATAFSCGLKTYNGAIGVDPSGEPCGTIMEAALERGMAVGLVVTSRVTHATPAAFSAHVGARDEESDIAIQQIALKLDLMFGGGLCNFVPNSQANEYGCSRPDDLDLLGEAKARGVTVAYTAADMEALNELPVMGLFAPSHMAFEIDRSTTDQPSLTAMVTKAVDLLSSSKKGRRNGYFLLVEGSRIDMAGHNNDIAAHVQDILAYQDAVASITKSVNLGRTLVVSVSDHETGGVTIARTMNSTGNYDVDYPYEWDPVVVKGVSHSVEYVAELLEGDPSLTIVDAFAQNFGLTDLMPSEIQALNESRTQGSLVFNLGAPVSLRSHTGFTTHGHTGVDVNLYAAGYLSDLFRGLHQNTDLSEIIQDIFNFKLDPITERLKTEKQVSSATSPSSSSTFPNTRSRAQPEYPGH